METVFHAACSSNFNHSQINDFLHWVRPGESLSKIALSYYHPVGSEVLNAIVEQMVSDNPQIANPNLIHPGQVILMRSPFRRVHSDLFFTNDIHETNFEWAAISDEIKQWITEHHSLLHAISLMNAGGHGAAHGADKILHLGKETIDHIVRSYLHYKKGEITKSAYDGIRRRLLTEYNPRIPSFYNGWKFGNLKSNEIFRITNAEARAASREVALTGSFNGARPMANQISKLAKSAKYLKTGVVLGTAVSAGIAGINVYEALGTERQNEVICEEAGGIGISTIATVVLAVGLSTTGIGLVAAAVLVGAAGAAAHAGGAAVGKAVCGKLGIIPGAHQVVPLAAIRVE